MPIQLTHDNKTVVIVGGGPIGLAHAWGLKKLNKNLNVIVKEKYQEYQRKHTLIMKPTSLEALMQATHTLEDPVLFSLLKRLKKDPHIRTNELEKIFKDMAIQNGVTISHEDIKPEIIHEQLAQHQPDLIIGADGTHSTVSKSLFPPDNQVKIEFDYVLQTRYEVNGDDKAKPIEQKDFVRDFIHHGVIANEYIGAFDEENNKTPVTMQMMISHAAYEKLKRATSKHPIQPLAHPDKQHQQHFLELHDIPDNVRSFLKSYLEKKTKIYLQHDHVLDPTSLTFSVNEAPATYAKQPVGFYDDVPMILVGDAALGLSYFKGLNAGLESTAQLLANLSACIQADFKNQDEFRDALKKYTHWFLNDFAPKKVKEVERYSSTYVYQKKQCIMPEVLKRFLVCKI